MFNTVYSFWALYTHKKFFYIILQKIIKYKIIFTRMKQINNRFSLNNNEILIILSSTIYKSKYMLYTSANALISKGNSNSNIHLVETAYINIKLSKTLST